MSATCTTLDCLLIGWELKLLLLLHLTLAAGIFQMLVLTAEQYLDSQLAVVCVLAVIVALIDNYLLTKFFSQMVMLLTGYPS